MTTNSVELPEEKDNFWFIVGGIVAAAVIIVRRFGFSDGLIVPMMNLFIGMKDGDGLMILQLILLVLKLLCRKELFGNNGESSCKLMC